MNEPEANLIRKHSRVPASVNSGRKSLALFGILIRDTQPNERDLSARGIALRRKLTPPTQCDLVALYIPWKIDQLIPSIRQGGDL